MRILLLLTLALTLSAADPKADVIRDSAKWRQAVIKQDEAALGKLLADDIL